MVRTLPSAIPPKMYRHFALVTLALTASVAMFADGENREVASAQVVERDAPPPPQQDLAPPARTAAPHRRETFVQRSAFDGFDASFGMPMDKTVGSLAIQTNRLAPEVAQAGYSEAYLASLDPGERDLLLRGLEQEGMLSPGERERRTAALVAASEARSGQPTANR